MNKIQEKLLSDKIRKKYCKKCIHGEKSTHFQNECINTSLELDVLLNKRGITEGPKRTDIVINACLCKGKYFDAKGT